MKYPGGHQSTMFVEQVGTVTALFDQWNDCERTVVLYALLKRLPFPNLKFLQLSIEYNIAQNINGGGGFANTKQQPTAIGAANGGSSSSSNNFNKFHLLESNSNNGIFLTKLISVYKNFRVPDLGQPPPPLDHTTSGRVPPVVYGIGNVPFEAREDILNDILTYLPLLKPGNEDAKAAYISLVPIVVADAIKQVIPTEMVQQILSYLLIHPAVTSEDRRSLAQWLHHLEEHINSMYIDAVVTSTTQQPPPPTPSAASVGGAAATVPVIHNNKMRSFSLTPTTTTGKLSGAFAAINETGPMPLNSSSCWETGNPAATHSQQRSLSCGTTTTTTKTTSTKETPHVKPHPNLLWALDTPAPQTAGAAGGHRHNSQDYVCDDHVIREFRKTIGRNIDGGLMPALKSSASSSLTSCCKSSLSSVSTSSAASTSSSSSSTSSISSSGSGGGGGGGIKGSGSGVGAPAVTASDPSSVFVVVPEQQEDLHVSFSKNGTEILDFDCDDDNKSNTQIAFEQPPPPINPRLVVADSYLAVPQHLDNCFCVGATPTGQCALLMHSSNALKTRRSNSLTTAPVTVSYPGHGNASSSSTENLLQLKPRSYSLSIEGHRGSLMSCGSDTRLEEMTGRQGVGGSAGGMLKMGGGGGGGMNPGMNCIGQWLKSLRLHKYVWLFSNISYEQMLEISEEYLANLSVTKGARHKLVLCIQKLRERGGVLLQMEQSLLAGDAHVAPMLEELTNIVLTPMKPIDPFSKDNIAGLFVKVIEMVGTILVTRLVQGPNDEEHVTAFLWILERALHNEAFLGQMNLLKELKFKVSKIKLQFVSKPHFGKVGASGTSGATAGSSIVGVVPTASPSVVPLANKSRWPVSGGGPSSSVLASGGGGGGGVSAGPMKGVMPPGMERKNSGPSLQSFSSMLQAPPQRLDEKNYFNAMGGVSAGQQQQQQHQQYSKSSSYPSFSQNLKFPASAAGGGGNPLIMTSGGTGAAGPGVMYHRHSINSGMPTAAPTTTSTSGVVNCSDNNNIRPAGGVGVGKENNENIDIGNHQQRQSLQQQQQCKDKNNIRDINSRLEFLCLQMTEQAIN